MQIELVAGPLDGMRLWVNDNLRTLTVHVHVEGELCRVVDGGVVPPDHRILRYNQDAGMPERFVYQCV